MRAVKEPKIYRDPDRGKILWIGILIALAVLAAIALATMSLNRTMKSAGAFTGEEGCAQADAEAMGFNLNLSLHQHQLEGPALKPAQTERIGHGPHEG